jgi:hypothetical protein
MEREVVVGVAFCTMAAEVLIVAAPHRGHMQVMVGVLQRMIARGVTVHAARMRQQFSDLGKNRARAFFLVRDQFKFRCALEFLMDNRIRFSFRKCD